MNIKLCAFDMDGTFLNGQHRVSASSKQIIDRLRKRDVIMVPTTGRCLDGIPGFLLENDRVDYTITSNGSRVFDVSKIETPLFTQSISYEDAFKILTLCEQYRVVVSVHIEGVNYDTARWMKTIKQWTTHRDSKIVSMFDNLRERVYREKIAVDKIQIFSWRTSNLTRLIADLSKIGDFNFPMTGGHYVEVTQANATKGQALKQLCGSLGINMSEVLVIGDGENDYSMFDVAGYSVAMGNAVANLKEKATFVTSSNQADGFAKAIELFLL